MQQTLAADQHIGETGELVAVEGEQINYEVYDYGD